MAILSTVLRGTHRTFWQITATFRTKVVSENPLTIIVELDLNMGGGNEIFTSSYVLDSAEIIQQINLTRGGTMKGELKLFAKERAVTYKGNFLIPNEVNIQFDSSIVAVF